MSMQLIFKMREKKRLFYEADAGRYNNSDTEMRKYSRKTEMQCEQETYLLLSSGNACSFYIEKDFHV